MTIVDCVLLLGAFLGYLSLFLLFKLSLGQMMRSQQEAIEHREKMIELDRQKQDFTDALKGIYVNLSEEQFQRIVLERTWRKQEARH